MIDKNILSENERRAIKIMAEYWKEVRSRENQNPLYEETYQIIDFLGVKILDIVEEYIEATEPEERRE